MFMDPAYIFSMDERERADFFANYNFRLGYHPETEDAFYVYFRDRFSGMYINGLPGSGKSNFMLNMLLTEAMNGETVILVDPHGDLIDSVVARLPEEQLYRTFILDMLDLAHPFGLNLLAIDRPDDPDALTVAVSKAIDRIMHVFEVLWPEVFAQQYLQSYLRASIVTLLANKDKTLLDILPLLKDAKYRQELLKNVTDAGVLRFWQTYDAMPPTLREQQTMSIVNRLNTLTMGRTVVTNIIGQVENTIDFRKTIEENHILLIKAPIKVLEHDARLIGTMLIARLHEALFSFGNLPPDKRPEFSLYVDEFSHFATKDFSEMFTEGRKFGIRTTVAHQFRGQLSPSLQEATMTARIKVIFQTTPEDGQKLGHLFAGAEKEIQREDIEPDTVDYLCTYGSPDPRMQEFTDTYLRPVQRAHKKQGKVNISKVSPELWVADPTPDMNHLLYEVQRIGNPNINMPPSIPFGYSNAAKCFWAIFHRSWEKKALCSPQIEHPINLVVMNAEGTYEFSRPVENEWEQMFHFFFYLRMTMQYLAKHPVGKQSTWSAAEAGHALASLPRRAAWVVCGQEKGVIYTDDSPTPVTENALAERLALVQTQTVQRYSKPKHEEHKEQNDVTDKRPAIAPWELEG